jgi:hypothetical protein
MDVLTGLVAGWEFRKGAGGRPQFPAALDARRRIEQKSLQRQRTEMAHCFPGAEARGILLMRRALRRSACCETREQTATGAPSCTSPLTTPIMDVRLGRTPDARPVRHVPVSPLAAQPCRSCSSALCATCKQDGGLDHASTVCSACRGFGIVRRNGWRGVHGRHCSRSIDPLVVPSTSNVAAEAMLGAAYY